MNKIISVLKWHISFEFSTQNQDSSHEIFTIERIYGFPRHSLESFHVRQILSLHIDIHKFTIKNLYLRHCDIYSLKDHTPPAFAGLNAGIVSAEARTGRLHLPRRFHRLPSCLTSLPKVASFPLDTFAIVHGRICIIRLVPSLIFHGMFNCGLTLFLRWNVFLFPSSF